MRIMLYRVLWFFILPIYILVSLYRAYKGKEQFARLPERFAIPGVKKTSSRVLWFHASSVGESMSILVLLEKILSEHKDIQIVVTTGTKTSAKLMKQRLPKGAVHQYLPWDFYLFVKMFLAYWKPAYSIFVESEFWPEHIHQAPNPILLNARISDRSFPKYMKNKWFKKNVIGKFVQTYGQDDLMCERLEALGVPSVKNYGNLKLDAVLAKPDEADLAKLQHAVENRKVLVVSLTHAPEESMLMETVQKLHKTHENMLTIIVPRHPHRGAEIEKMYQKSGFEVARRSVDAYVEATTDVYVADTVGEMPLWYSVASAVIIGGSFVNHGGQNPYESLKMGCNTYCGPHMFNFKEVMRVYKSKQIITQLNAVEDVYDAIGATLKSPQKTQQQITQQMNGLGGAVDKVYEDIDALIKEIPVEQ